MKKLAILVAFIVSSSAFASGKLTLQPMYSSTGEFLRPQIGLSVYEKTKFKNLSYVGWIGTGPSLTMVPPENENLQWYTMKHSFESYFGRFAIGPGFQTTWNDIDGFSKRIDVIYVKASYQLW
jgi:hypothetical protein